MSWSEKIWSEKILTGGWAATVQSIAGTIAIAVFVVTFLAQAFTIPSESMEQTLLIGDYLLVDKLCYGDGGLWSRLLP
ncbi:MAG: S26 family signal peptidase, partial [Terriglobales bacterium]